MLLYFLPLNYCDIQSPEKHEHAVITDATIKIPVFTTNMKNKPTLKQKSFFTTF